MLEDTKGVIEKGQTIHWPKGQTIHWPKGQTIHWPKGQTIHWPKGQTIHWPKEKLDLRMPLVINTVIQSKICGLYTFERLSHQNNDFFCRKFTKAELWYHTWTGLWLKGVSEWLVFNANSTIFQLYHGENKLIFNEMMMMRSTLF